MSWISKLIRSDVILLYHRVTRLELDPWGLSVTPEHFAEHLEVLRRFPRIPLNEVRRPVWRTGQAALRFAITFDDGYFDNLDQAAPLLEKYDTPATFFIATGYIGG